MNELAVFLPLENGDKGRARRDGPPARTVRPVPAGSGLPMGYDDLKVIEAALFLQSVVDGEQREPGVREALAGACVIAAMERSARSGVWEPVEDLTPTVS